MRVLKFSASWCGPCKMLSESMKGWDLNGVNVEEVDIDTNREAAIEYGIRGVPTLIVLDEQNNVKARIVGLVNEKTFRESISQ